MIITGGENVSPVEIESCLSLHPGVLEVAVVGLPTSAGARSSPPSSSAAAPSTSRNSTQFCRASGLANFKRPRRFIFVDDVAEIPGRKIAAPPARRRRVSAPNSTAFDAA